MNFNDLPDEALVIAKIQCDKSLLFFTRFFFKLLRGSKFMVNWHHEEICHELEKTANYEYEFFNINIPPRFSKTELVGINFIAWSLSKNPRANFLYITGSDELRSETSIRIRDIITHPVYIKMYGVEIKKDQSGKNLWRTKQGGGLKTATIFGQITGFGAGRIIDTDLIDYIKSFDGAIILDDINKIIDSASDNANNQKAVDTIFTTILSRKNSENTPLINIQQRAGLNDATASLLEYFKKNKMKSLVMPVITDGVPLWDYKLSLKGIEELRTSPFTSATFETQYMQNPIDYGSNKFKSEYFEIIKQNEVPRDVKWQMFIDGAYTKLTTNDPTGLMICGMHNENLIIKISIDRYLELPELLTFIDNFATANDFDKKNRIFVEPKASGLSLRQFLNKKRYNAIDISNKYVGVSKIERADTSLPFCETGKIKLIEGDWNFAFLEQLKKFPNDKHDEHVDLISYAIIENYIMKKQEQQLITNISDLFR